MKAAKEAKGVHSFSAFGIDGGEELKFCRKFKIYDPMRTSELLQVLILTYREMLYEGKPVKNKFEQKFVKALQCGGYVIPGFSMETDAPSLAVYKLYDELFVDEICVYPFGSNENYEKYERLPDETIDSVIAAIRETCAKYPRLSSEAIQAFLAYRGFYGKTYMGQPKDVARKLGNPKYNVRGSESAVFRFLSGKDSGIRNKLPRLFNIGAELEREKRDLQQELSRLLETDVYKRIFEIKHRLDEINKTSFI